MRLLPFESCIGVHPIGAPWCSLRRAVRRAAVDELEKVDPALGSDVGLVPVDGAASACGCRVSGSGPGGSAERARAQQAGGSWAGHRLAPAAARLLRAACIRPGLG